MDPSVWCRKITNEDETRIGSLERKETGRWIEDSERGIFGQHWTPLAGRPSAGEIQFSTFRWFLIVQHARSRTGNNTERKKTDSHSCTGSGRIKTPGHETLPLKCIIDWTSSSSLISCLNSRAAKKEKRMGSLCGCASQECGEVELFTQVEPLFFFPSSSSSFFLPAGRRDGEQRRKQKKSGWNQYGNHRTYACGYTRDTEVLSLG